MQKTNTTMGKICQGRFFADEVGRGCLKHQGCRGFKSQPGKAGGLGVGVMPVGLRCGSSRWFLAQVTSG